MLVEANNKQRLWTLMKEVVTSYKFDGVLNRPVRFKYPAAELSKTRTPDLEVLEPMIREDQKDANRIEFDDRLASEHCRLGHHGRCEFL